MQTMPKCILITGIGHSGTRLLVQMLARHHEVSVPSEALNAVQEFYPLHRLFIQFLDATSLHSPNYAINFDELRFTLDAYMLNIDKSKKTFVLKLPFYPLLCLDKFVEYYQGNIVLANVRRPIEKVVQSYIRRGEDKRFFDDPLELMRQVKKLDPSLRGKYLARKDPPAFFREIERVIEEKVLTWERQQPQYPFVDIDIEQLANSKPYIGSVLTRLQLSTQHIDELAKEVDQQRLLEGTQKHGHKPHFSLRRWLKKLVG